MFMIRRARTFKNQEVPSYMRITGDGERAEISLKRSVNPACWNDIKGCAKSGTPYAKELNFFLEQIRHKVYEHQQDRSSNHPMRKVTLKLEEVDRPFLTEKELNTIMGQRFAIQRIAQVRDVFIFCCFTGLAFVDVKSLKKNDIILKPKGDEWIHKQRQSKHCSL